MHCYLVPGGSPDHDPIQSQIQFEMGGINSFWGLRGRLTLFLDMWQAYHAWGYIVRVSFAALSAQALLTNAN